MLKWKNFYSKIKNIIYSPIFLAAYYNLKGAKTISTSETLTENKKERIEWIDALKGFAIFCVTIGHCNTWAPMEKYIYSFHMFVFFFISGFLFSAKQSTKQMLKSRTKRLLISFIAWNSLSAFMGYMLELDPQNLFEEFFVLKGNLTWNSPLWFLLVLFVTELVVILLKLYKKIWVMVATMVVSLVLWVLVGHGWILWKLNLVPMGLAFFIMGYLCKNAIPVIKKWYVILPSGIGSVVFSMLNIRIVYTYGKFGNYLYCFLAAVFGVLFFVGLFSCIKSFKYAPFLKSWGKNSLLIMTMQFGIFHCISEVSKTKFNFDLGEYPSFVISLAVSIFTILSIMLRIFIYKKISRNIKPLRILGKIFGVQY